MTIALANSTGALFWFLQCTSTDDTNAAATINASLVINQTTKTATFTAPTSAGSAVIFTSTVGISSTTQLGAGRDLGGVLHPEYTTTFKVNVPTSGGLHVIAQNEVYEQNPTFGNIAEVNAAIRAGGGGGGSVTWAGDLAFSNNSDQWVGAISGPNGFGGSVALNGVTAFAQSGTGAANATAASLTFSTQAVNATNGSAGSLYANVPAPTGTGAEGYFAVSRGGTANTFAQLGAVPGTSGGYGGLWILSSGATTTNYVIQSDGFYGYFNAPHYNAYICSAGTAYHMFNSNGAMIGSATANFSGASGGIIGMANASVAASSAAGAGGSTLWGDTLGLHYVGASASFCDYMIAPVQQGTANTQQNKFRVYSGVARTTTNSAVTILTIPVSTSGSVATIAVTVSARDVSSGTVGDGFSQLVLFQYKNVGGTVTAAAANAVSMGKCNDTSMSSCTVTATISGTNVLVQVTGISAVTIDWTAEANVTIT